MDLTGVNVRLDDKFVLYQSKGERDCASTPRDRFEILIARLTRDLFNEASEKDLKLNLIHLQQDVKELRSLFSLLEKDILQKEEEILRLKDSIKLLENLIKKE